MSIGGFVSRHPLLSLGVVAGLWWLWPASSSAPRPHAQAAVLENGFAAIDGANRIVELDEAAHRRRELAVTGAPAGGRVVGAGGHIALVWRDGKQMAVALVDHDGELGRPQRFGKRVSAVCDGVATNEHRFGVAWLEADGSVWFVHGPTSARQGAGDADSGAALEAMQLAEPLKSDSCAIASAGEKIALLITEGKRTTLALCGRQCSGARRIELPAKSTVLGFGCTAGACVVATRGEAGLQATWVSAPAGRAQWTKPLPHASPDSQVALAGTETQVAIAYATSNEPVVVIASKAGAIQTIWQGAADAVPSIVHSRGRLLVARSAGGELAGSIVRAP